MGRQGPGTGSVNAGITDADNHIDVDVESRSDPDPRLETHTKTVEHAENIDGWGPRSRTRGDGVNTSGPRTLAPHHLTCVVHSCNRCRIASHAHVACSALQRDVVVPVTWHICIYVRLWIVVHRPPNVHMHPRG